MKRQSPLRSTLGFLFTAVMLAGMGWMVWRSGGMAFSPGDLSVQGRPGARLQGFDSHASFEGQCSRCHRPLETTQDRLCLACHERAAGEIAAQTGTHGRIEAVQRCAACHSDHQGKGFDLMAEARQQFDHDRTRFSLVWHQVNYDMTPMDCTGCHAVPNKYARIELARAALAPLPACADCHGDHDPDFMQVHESAYGSGCLDCHKGRDRLESFDHAAVAFRLDGAHAQVSCAGCHGLSAVWRAGAGLQRSDPFRDAPQDCSGCHTETPRHRGVFSGRCASCHSVFAWTPANLDGQPFQHDQATRFSLVKHKQSANGQPIGCLDCHAGDVRHFVAESCRACHSQGEERVAFMDAHLEQFGPNCLDCHDGADRLSDFNHAAFFPLDGRHAQAACETCHAERRFRGTPAGCAACHAEPEIHAGFFGLQCQACHTAQAWTPASLQVHPFPLKHGSESPLDCRVCHPERYVAYTCYDCHDHQPESITASHLQVGIQAQELPDCARCHPEGSR